MDFKRRHRILLSLAASGVLLSGLFLLLNAAPRTAVADSGQLFAAADGSGTACLQGSPCDLPTAIDESAGGDTIYVAQGTYTGTGSAVITITKSITLYGGWDGSATGPVLRDSETYATTLDGEGQRRVVYIAGAVAPTIDGFIITGGNATGLAVTPYSQYGGGGIYSINASPIIVNNVITHNTASTSTSTYGRGGGIHLVYASATVVVSGNLIISNTASTGENGYGGGISTYDSYVTIENNEVLSNVGSTADPGEGGGILLQGGSPSAVGNQIQGNKASTYSGGGGGGVALYMSHALVEGNVFTGNQAGVVGAGTGGAILVNQCHPTLRGNWVVSNSARWGGGLEIYSDEPITMTNNIIARNLATTSGGGMRIRGTAGGDIVHGVLRNNTIAINGDQGIYLAQYAVLTLTNNIIVSHTNGIDASTGTTVTADHTLFFGNTGADITGPGSTASSGETTGTAPLFVNPASDYHIRSGSPAVDAGAVVPGLTTDIDGDPRPWPTGGAFDIGADEVCTWTVYLPLVLRGF